MLLAAADTVDDDSGNNERVRKLQLELDDQVRQYRELHTKWKLEIELKIKQNKQFESVKSENAQLEEENEQHEEDIAAYETRVVSLEKGMLISFVFCCR